MNIKDLILSATSFFLSIILIIIISMVASPIISIGEEIFPGLADIIWFGLIVLFVTIAIVKPALTAYQIAQETTRDTNAFQQVAVSILTIIFGLIITIKAWFMITAMGDIISGAGMEPLLTEFLIGLYWTGFGIGWILTIIIVPAYTIIANTQTEA